MKAKKYFRFYFVLLIGALTLCFIYFDNKDRVSVNSILSYVAGDTVVYSEKSGVYHESLSISLELDKEFPAEADIYYTVDGSNPTKNGKKYENEIKLNLNSQLKRYEVKSAIYYKGEYSDVFEEEYILCKRAVENEIDTLYIMTDKNNLYDYNTGIFVKGKVYDDLKQKQEGKVEVLGGNYSLRGDEWIRNAYMVMVDSEGNPLINDKIGIGVSGGGSSAFPVKSLKIYSDEKYGSKNDKFQLDLREDRISYWSNVTEYNSLRLRSGSQDVEGGNIRSAVVSSLANSSNFDGCTESRRCIVYLNGSFYGLFDIQQNYSDSFLARRFNLKESDKIEKVKGSEYASLEYVRLRNLFQKDLNYEENRKELESQIDMDNYLLYYAIEILCGNTDWPGNNFEMWRYIGQKDVNNDYADGRWRFLLYDTDLTFPVEATPNYFEGCKEEQFDVIMQGRNRAADSTFTNVMRSVYYRDMFITIVCDLLNTSFSGSNLVKTMNAENQLIESARDTFYDELFAEQAEIHLKQMRQYALERSSVIEECISRYFGFTNKYRMNLDIPDGVKIYWNNEKFYAGDKYSCEYYQGVHLVLNQEAYPGYQFKYWSVNGEQIYDKELTVTEEMTITGSVHIIPVMEKCKTPCLIISGIHARGDEDWIELMNVGASVIDISKYYLTDDTDNLKQYQLPKKILKENETVIIYGSKNRGMLGEYICNFSLSEYEMLTLSDGNIINDWVYVPKMGSRESYIRYNYSNQWVYYMEP